MMTRVRLEQGTVEGITNGGVHTLIAFARLGVPRNSDGSPWPRYERTAPLLTLIENEMTSRPFVIDELTTLIHALRTEDDLDGSH